MMRMRVFLGWVRGVIKKYTFSQVFRFITVDYIRTVNPQLRKVRSCSTYCTTPRYDILKQNFELFTIKPLKIYVSCSRPKHIIKSSGQIVSHCLVSKRKKKKKR